MKSMDRTTVIRELESFCGIPRSLLLRLNDEELFSLYRERVGSFEPEGKEKLMTAGETE
ncbi:hypothetical protein [Alteribacillus sp. HJP-4]|uniref:hypothetical protein n=1 Tax=Alteribacillus sp. HJP-4 TaxID=2775394 RepID=UPI0035CCD206